MDPMNNGLPIIEIAPAGDVIIIADRRLLVNSTVLRKHSSVFAGMVDPYFKQYTVNGHQISTAGPISIVVPEVHDGRYVHMVCLAMHGRFDELPAKMSPQEVFGLADVAKSYKCGHVFRDVCSAWLDPRWVHVEPATTPSSMEAIMQDMVATWEKFIDPADFNYDPLDDFLGIRYVSDEEENALSKALGQLMVAAWIFENARAFCDITHALVFQHKGSFMKLGRLINEFAGIPNKAFKQMEKNRVSLRKALDREMFTHAMPSPEDYYDIRENSVILTVTQVMRSMGLSPLMEVLKDNDRDSLESELDEYNRALNPSIVVSEGCWREECMGVFSEAQGVCIDCVRARGPKLCEEHTVLKMKEERGMIGKVHEWDSETSESF